MPMELTPCKVRVTEAPGGGAFAERVTSITRFDDEAKRPIAAPVEADDPSVPLDVQQRAPVRVAALLAPMYERQVMGCGHPRCDCAIDANNPKVTSTVDLVVETFVQSNEGGWYRVEGTAQVVRKYYDGICDEVRRRV